MLNVSLKGVYVHTISNPVSDSLYCACVLRQRDAFPSANRFSASRKHEGKEAKTKRENMH